MKRYMSAMLVVLVCALGIALAADEIPDSSMGLSKTSVFDTPTPEPFEYEDIVPEYQRPVFEAAPVIPHKSRIFEQIRRDRNQCMRCHVIPEKVGEAPGEGEPKPMPADHYERLESEGEPARVHGGHWVCTQCHVAQANIGPLVPNSAGD